MTHVAARVKPRVHKHNGKWQVRPFQRVDFSKVCWKRYLEALNFCFKLNIASQE